MSLKLKKKKITCYNNISLLTKHNDNKPYGFWFEFQWLFLVLNGFSMTIEFTAKRLVHKTLSINFQRIWVVIFKNERHPTEPFSNILFNVIIRWGSRATSVLCCNKKSCGIVYIKRGKPHFVFSSTLSPKPFFRELLPRMVSLFFFLNVPSISKKYEKFFCRNREGFHGQS